MIPLLDKLRQDSTIRALLVLVLGLVFMDFLFSLLFGSNNMMQRYMNFTYLIIEILMLILVGSFIFGIYLIIKEYGKPFFKEYLNIELFKSCQTCRKGLKNSWNCCPFCGSELIDERNKA